MYINNIYRFFAIINFIILYQYTSVTYSSPSDGSLKRSHSDGSLRLSDQHENTKPLSNAVDSLYQLKLAKLRSLLEVNKHIFIHNNVNLLDKYDIVKMIANYPLTSVYTRTKKNICSKFRWENANSDWISRFSTYNYHLCALEQGGGGDCFFHSLAGSLRMSGFTKERIKRHNKNNPLYKRFGSSQSNGAYYSHVELRKISAAYFSTFNPEIPGDEKNFNEALFRDRMGFFIRDGPEGIVENFDEQMKVKLNESLADTPAIKVAKEVYEINAKPAGYHWGDWFDKSALESILGLTIILFRNVDTCINMGEFRKSTSPTIYVLLYYMDMVHYKSAGLVDINTPLKIHSAFDSDSLPEVLSLMAFIDCDAEL